jgi:16S rRNA (guanine(966)-N(2))-methyltransferase RsmD
MRIVSGSLKGRRIKVPKSLKLRPTTDFAKEGLFNILAHQIDFEGLKVLDCFFGTGNISLEFVSRGAEHVTSVDINKGSYSHLSKLCREWNLEEIDVIRADVMNFLRSSYGSYDLVFCDPPFDFPELGEIPRLVFENDLVNENGMLIVEHGERTSLAQEAKFVNCRKFGSVNFSFFEV